MSTSLSEPQKYCYICCGKKKVICNVRGVNIMCYPKIRCYSVRCVHHLLTTNKMLQCKGYVYHVFLMYEMLQCKGCLDKVLLTNMLSLFCNIQTMQTVNCTRSARRVRNGCHSIRPLCSQATCNFWHQFY